MSGKKIIDGLDEAREALAELHRDGGRPWGEIKAELELIPADVMERAKAAADQWWDTSGDDYELLCRHISQALLSERQRALEEAAKIAIVTSARFGDVLGIGTQVASAIRSAS